MPMTAHAAGIVAILPPVTVRTQAPRSRVRRTDQPEFAQ